jgi:hypothetical protein
VRALDPVVIATATAIYFNPDGALVIRQRAAYPDDDPFIFRFMGNSARRTGEFEIMRFDNAS